MRELRSYASRFRRWSADGQPHWFCLVGILVLPFCWWLFEDAECSVRFAGLLLQMIGMLGVIVEIRKVIDRFGGEGYWTSAKRWIIGFPKWRLPEITCEGIAEGFWPHDSGRIRAGATPQEGAQLEDRVRFLEERLNSMLAEIDQLSDRQLRHHQERTNALRQARSQLSGQIDSVRTDFIDFHISDVHLALVSAWMLAIGIILATVPDGVLKFLEIV